MDIRIKFINFIDIRFFGLGIGLRIGIVNAIGIRVTDKVRVRIGLFEYCYFFHFHPLITFLQ